MDRRKELVRFDKGEAIGMAKGEESGRNKEKVEIATNMKRLGVSTDVISQATGLSADEIDAI